MSPYLLLGFLFAGLLKFYFPQRILNRYMGKSNASASFYAGLLGVPMPLCSCGVLPTGISLFRNGASRAATTSFLISTPQTGVDSMLVTYSMLGLPFAIVRPLVALATGFTGGVLANIFGKKDAVGCSREAEESAVVPGKGIKAMLRFAFLDFLQDISKWLVLGLLLAALVAVAVPDNYFTNIQSGQLTEMLLVLAASVPMYVCATASVPLAAVLLLKGLSPGAVFVFLMAGPATNAATITVLLKTLGRLNTAIYLGTIVTGAVIAGVLINQLPTHWFTLEHIHHAHVHGEMLPAWLRYFSSLSLLLLIAIALFSKYKHKKGTNMNMQFSMDQNRTRYKVGGMECSHCKKSVETNLLKIEGVVEVEADIVSGTVTVKSKEIDMAKVKETVEKLGYSFGGKV